MAFTITAAELLPGDVILRGGSADTVVGVRSNGRSVFIEWKERRGRSQFSLAKTIVVQNG